MAFPGFQTYHDVYVRRDDAGREFSGADIRDSKWRRKSPHEAPPTTGILSLYNRGDRRRWYWPCPHCGEYFQPAMESMTGYRDEPDPVKASESAHLLCPHCSGVITADKSASLTGGSLVA
jgi:phage terminase large subunit GpA-like protein